MRLLLVGVAAVALALLPSRPAAAVSLAGGPRGAVLASASGRIVVGGEEVTVDVIVLASDAEHGEGEAQAALRRRFPSAALGARGRGGTVGYTTNGLVWTTLPVAVNYNDSGAPLSGALAELTAAMATWTAVTTSSFAYAPGVSTSRCPSMVDECPGAQTFDGNNDVGWLDIGGPSILGITWYGTKTREFDMALDNRNFAWATGCGTNYSVQSVFLHELGHALGLGHSKDPANIMYATYLGARCSLGAGDVQGVSALYPQ